MRDIFNKGYFVFAYPIFFVSYVDTQDIQEQLDVVFTQTTSSFRPQLFISRRSDCEQKGTVMIQFI